jgi:hypothetical protein
MSKQTKIVVSRKKKTGHPVKVAGLIRVSDSYRIYSSNHPLCGLGVFFASFASIFIRKIQGSTRSQWKVL